MPANTLPIFTATPNITTGTIPSTNAVVRSDGVSTTGGTAAMVNIFAAGTNGSYVDRVRVYPVAASAAVSTTATTVRIFLSTVADPSASNTTAANTKLLAEASIAAVSASHSTNAVPYVDVPIGFAIPTGTYLHACQHVAQANSAILNCMAIGGNY